MKQVTHLHELIKKKMTTHSCFLFSKDYLCELSLTTKNYLHKYLYEYLHDDYLATKHVVETACSLNECKWVIVRLN